MTCLSEQGARLPPSQIDAYFRCAHVLTTIDLDSQTVKRGTIEAFEEKKYDKIDEQAKLLANALFADHGEVRPTHIRPDVDSDSSFVSPSLASHQLSSNYVAGSHLGSPQSQSADAPDGDAGVDEEKEFTGDYRAA